MGKIVNPFEQKQVKVEAEFCGRTLSIETGDLAFQAGGSVIVRCGDSVVLGVATAADSPVEGMDYFPLSIEYEERMYAAGKISGSRFVKREGRPSEKAVLTARLIDRPIRPLFPKGYQNEVQGIATVLSLDPEVQTDILAMIAVSTALMLTGAPFDGPIAGVRMGLIDGKLVACADTSKQENSDLDLVVAGTADAIMMVEAGANEVDEETMLKALEEAHKAIQPAIKLQQELVSKLDIQKQEYELVTPSEDVIGEVRDYLKDKLGDIVTPNKLERKRLLAEKRDSMIAELEEKHGEDFEAGPYKEAFTYVVDKEVRRAIVEDGVRPDGRKLEDIRTLSSEVGVLPRTHGSAIFTRGSTQSLNVLTLAPLSYAQTLDSMDEDKEVTFFHHYNFPGYSVGEIKRLGGPGRREIGHGALAQRAIEPVLPSTEDFPYTIRAVSEILSSTGSTSMAAVCSTTLSLMDAGVPIKAPVAGIAMGLISDGDKPQILTDIHEAEDFAGDMDFKVAGTDRGITALQMDIKIKGITTEIMKTALEHAKTGRAKIMEHIKSVLAEPRKEMSPYAPRVVSIKINPDKVRDIIGKGGETINKIIDDTGAEIDIREDIVMIAAPDKESIEKAKDWIDRLTAEPEVGKTYTGKVVKILEFGFFVQILPGTDGMVHVSEIADKHIDHPSDVVSEGDEVKVKLVAIDDRGRLVLSMKQANE